MLILTRRIGESLMIGDDVNVTILGIRGNQVRIGSMLPRNCGTPGGDLRTHPTGEGKAGKAQMAQEYMDDAEDGDGEPEST